MYVGKPKITDIDGVDRLFLVLTRQIRRAYQEDKELVRSIDFELFLEHNKNAILMRKEHAQSVCEFAVYGMIEENAWAWVINRTYPLSKPLRRSGRILRFSESEPGPYSQTKLLPRFLERYDLWRKLCRVVSCLTRNATWKYGMRYSVSLRFVESSRKPHFNLVTDIEYKSLR